MLTLEQRLQLINAGYTKTEIESMADPEPKPADPGPKPADPEPKPADPEPKPADPEPKPAVDPAIEKMSADFEKAIADLKAMIQKKNISDVNNPQPQQQTAEEALGSLVAAPMKK